MKKQSEIRSNPLKDPCRINVILEKEDLTALKQKALYHDTTVNEIVRDLIARYIHEENEAMSKRVFFRICYGIKAFNSDGSEQPHDVCSSGALYTSLETAISNQKIWFDSQCEEMKRHSPQRRKQEQAFCFIEPVSGVSDENPDGENAYEGLDPDMVKKIDATYMSLNGKEIVNHW